MRLFGLKKIYNHFSEWQHTNRTAAQRSNHTATNDDGSSHTSGSRTEARSLARA